MTRETRFEYYDRVIGPDARRMAERLVEQRGADALKYWITLGCEHGITKTHEAVLSAIPSVMVQRLTRDATDPNAVKTVFQQPGMVTLGSTIDAVDRLRPNRAATSDYAQTEMLTLWHEAVHRHHGRKTYEIDLGLAERLAQTELRGLSTDDLKLPFRSIYVQIPPSVGLKIANVESGEHTIEGAYVAEVTGDDEPRWAILLWGPPKEGAKTIYDDALFCFSVALPPGMDLDAALTQNEHGFGSHVPETTRAFHRENWRRLFKFLMNVVVYITWSDARIEELIGNAEWAKLSEQLHRHPRGSGKYERARLALREIDPQRRIYLGRGTPRFEGVGASHGSLAVRTLVTGHWQRFAHGPGRTERKWGWRMPFWRGPEGLESNPRRVVI